MSAQPKTPNLDELAYLLEQAKDKENAAKAQRIDLENQIASLLSHPPEGSKTHTGDWYKVTVKGAINRTVDKAGLTENTTIPQAIKDKVFNWKPSINLSGYRYVQNNEPELFNQISEYVTSKPGKTAVTIKRITNGN